MVQAAAHVVTANCASSNVGMIPLSRGARQHPTHIRKRH
jgi:hypothetical protein